MAENLIGGVTSVVTADTTQFDAAYKKSGEVADATARQVAKAAKLKGDAEAFAAKYAADAITDASIRAVAARRSEQASLADLRKAQALVKAGYGDEVEGAQLVAAALQRYTVASAEAAAATRAMGEAGHATVSQMQATSAAVRSFEGNPGIRTIERFLTWLPGAGAAAQALFPLVGLGATVGLVAQMGGAFYEAEQKGKHAAEEITKAVADQNTKLDYANHEMELSTSRVLDNIAKLEKHPGDGLRTALLEAAAAADKLEESLSGAIKAENEALKQTQISAVDAFFSNTGSTTGANKEVSDLGKDVESKQRDAEAARRKALADAGTDRDKQIAAQKAYYQKIDDIAAEAASKMRARATDIKRNQDAENETAQSINASGEGAYAPRNLGDKGSVFQSTAVMYDKLQSHAQDAGAAFSADAKNKDLEGAKEKADAAKQAAQQAFEARKSAIEAELSSMKADHDVSVAEEYSFWVAKVAAAKQGSLEWTYVYQKLGDANQALGKALDEAGKQLDEAAKKRQDAIKQWDSAATRLSDEMDKAEGRATEAAAKLRSAQNDASIQMGELQTSHDVATGAITKYDAAVKMAAFHVAQYGEVLKNLQAEQDALDQRSDMLPDDRLAQQRDIDAKREKASGDASRTSASDAWNIQQQTASGAATQAFQSYIAQSKDTATQIKTLIDGALNGLNEQLVRGMTGQKTDFRGLGRNVAGSVASAGLSKVEGTVMEGLGLGAKGTRGNPLWVQLANSIGGVTGTGAASGAGAFLQSISSMGSSSSSDSTSNSGSTWGSKASGVVSTLLGLIPHFADGGVASVNVPSLIGEAGPELFFPKTSGTIMPNKALGSMGSTTHNWSIDARGSSDPAAVEAAVQRGIAKAAPGIAAAGARMGMERQMRRPSTAR